VSFCFIGTGGFNNGKCINVSRLKERVAKPSLNPLSRCESAAKRRGVKKARAKSGSSTRAEADWSSYRFHGGFSASESTQNRWLLRRALKSSRSRRERDTAIDRRCATERPKLIGSRISIDGTISTLMYQFALRSRVHCAAASPGRTGSRMNPRSRDETCDRLKSRHHRNDESFRLLRSEPGSHLSRQVIRSHSREYRVVVTPV